MIKMHLKEVGVWQLVESSVILEGLLGGATAAVEFEEIYRNEAHESFPDYNQIYQERTATARTHTYLRLDTAILS